MGTATSGRSRGRVVFETKQSRLYLVIAVGIFLALQFLGAIAADEGYPWIFDESVVLYGWAAYWTMIFFVVLMGFTIYGVMKMMIWIATVGHWVNRGSR